MGDSGGVSGSWLLAQPELLDVRSLSLSLCLPNMQMNKHLKNLFGLFHRPCSSLRISRPGPQPAAEQPLSLPGASGERLLLLPVCVLWSGCPFKGRDGSRLWAKQSSPRIAQEPE